MMANATRDPLFLAALTVANQDDEIGEACLSCHSPTAHVRGNTEAHDGSQLDHIDNQGVGCESCHLSAPTGDAAEPYTIASGELYFPNDGVLRGPYADSPAPHPSKAEPALSESAFCGQCHTVFNGQPMYNEEREVIEESFPLDTTYLEWQQSDFADVDDPVECATCHMPRVEGDLPVALGDAPLRENPRTRLISAATVQY